MLIMLPRLDLFSSSSWQLYPSSKLSNELPDSDFSELSDALFKLAVKVLPE
jgi:hypothetical protein